eukprot:1708385-Amphidinium_carterae.2
MGLWTNSAGPKDTVPQTHSSSMPKKGVLPAVGTASLYASNQLFWAASKVLGHDAATISNRIYIE